MGNAMTMLVQTFLGPIVGYDCFKCKYEILQQVESYRAGQLKTYTLDEVEQRLGLED